MQKQYFYLFIILILLQACTAPLPSTPTDATETLPESAMETQLSVETETPATTAEVPARNEIDHEIVPGEGITDRATAHDHDSALSFDKKVVRSGDEFFRNRFERPFTENDMEYLPDLDIVNFSITSDDTFFYIRISFVGLNEETQSLTGSYGVEIDRNGDGRAEVLLVTNGPYSEEYSADDVTVYLDMNSDIGGSKINRPDDFKSDGFETTIYDLGRNVYPEGDADLAWVRQSMDGACPRSKLPIKNGSSMMAKSHLCGAWMPAFPPLILQNYMCMTLSLRRMPGPRIVKTPIIRSNCWQHLITPAACRLALLPQAMSHWGVL
jgi:hypothetical protein